MKICLVLYLVSFAFLQDPTEPFVKRIDLELRKNFDFPPDFGDSCYYYSELLRLTINGRSSVSQVEFSDSGPKWLKDELAKVLKNNRLKLNLLDSIAKSGKFKDCYIAIPFIIESGLFPCGQAKVKYFYKDGLYQFGGKNLKGNVVFTKAITFIYSHEFQTKTPIETH